MELKEQVNTLEQGERFYKLGLELDSYFVWKIFSQKIELSTLVIRAAINKDFFPILYPAYTYAELQELLDQIQAIDNARIHQKAWTSGIIAKIQTPEIKKMNHTHRTAEIVLAALKLEIVKSEELKL